MDNAGYLVGGYAVTAVALAGYWALLRRRARRARERLEALRAGR